MAIEIKNSEDAVTNGLRELLEAIPENEVAKFLKSTCCSLIPFGTVPCDENGHQLVDPLTHAINSILMYTDAITLLNKQRMKKTYLAQYLNQKGIRMTIPATKNSLCQDVLKYWGGQQIPENVRLIEDEGVNKQQSQQRPHAQPGPAIKNERVHESLPNSQQNQPNSSSPITTASSSREMVAQHQEVDCMDYEYESAVSLRQREAQLGEQLGREFSIWFYERLNTLTDFTPQHFWPECNFRLEIVFSSESDKAFTEEIVRNGEICCAKMKDLVAVKQLYFNPNVDLSGIRGYLNPHGLAQVMVCGIIYSKESNSPVGVFEQMFGLMRDPRLGNNYKVKFSVLRLREGSQLAIQSNATELCDTSLVGIIEEIDD